MHEMGYLKEDGTIQVTAEGDEEEFCSKILEKAKISISSVIEKKISKVSLKIGNDNEIVTAGKYEKSAKDTSEKPAADKRKSRSQQSRKKIKR